MILVIGNNNYSSCSLRPWLALKVCGFDFDEKRIPLYGAGSKEAILELPAMQEWSAAAEREAESLPQFDMYE